MKQFTIRNGNFVTETGNFSAYTAEGKRMFVPGRLMSSLGFSADQPIKYPFYILADEETITPFKPGTKELQYDKDGVVITALRYTAKSAYLDKVSMFDATNDSAILAAEAKAHFVKTTQELGLTAADVTAFANASI